MGVLSLDSLGSLLFRPPSRRRDGVNLRAAFAVFLVWLVLLALTSRAALAAYDSGNALGLAGWLICGYLFYLSLCCTFFPARSNGAARSSAAAEVPPIVPRA